MRALSSRTALQWDADQTDKVSNLAWMVQTQLLLHLRSVSSCAKANSSRFPEGNEEAAAYGIHTLTLLISKFERGVLIKPDIINNSLQWAENSSLQLRGKSKFEFAV
jgi:hypothetical protein